VAHRVDLLLAGKGALDQAVVKVCGLQEESHARAAAMAGADMIGFMMAPSRRRIAPRAARAIAEALRSEGLAPLAVGVFVNETPATIHEAVDQAGLDAVQLSGDEHPDVMRELHVPVIKAIRPNGVMAELELVRTADSWLARAQPAALLLVDGHRPGSYGGSGVLADWAAAKLLARRYPVLLAGGLTPANVRDALTEVRPLGVDVSSGVEVAGVKQSERIAAFIAAARATLPVAD
jgi:phosphoribosylanthranilate isomerase